MSPDERSDEDVQREIRERFETTRAYMSTQLPDEEPVTPEERKIRERAWAAKRRWEDITRDEDRLRILARAGDVEAQRQLIENGVDLLREAAASLAAAPKPTLDLRSILIADVRNPPVEEFVLDGMIPFGKSSVLFGPQSVGKSALAAQVVFAFAAGEERIWGLPLYPGGGPVLVYSAEDSLDDWVRKAAAISQATTINVEGALNRIWVVDKSEGVARLSEVVTVRLGSESRREARPTAEADAIIEAALGVGAKLILIETASRLVDDEDNAAMSALQSALGRIARATGAAVICIHHPTKAASKDNDSAIESARGGGAFTMNSRNVLTVFPASSDEAKPWADRFPADDLVVLGHGKPSPSTRRHAPITLVRCDGGFGAVFSLPDDVALNPEQAQRNAARVELDRQRVWGQLRHLYEKVEDFLQTGPVSRHMLHQRHGELGLPRDAVYPLIEVALTRGVLKIATRNKRGITLALGNDPRRAINGDPVPDDSGGSES